MKRKEVLDLLKIHISTLERLVKKGIIKRNNIVKNYYDEESVLKLANTLHSNNNKNFIPKHIALIFYINFNNEIHKKSDQELLYNDYEKDITTKYNLSKETYKIYNISIKEEMISFLDSYVNDKIETIYIYHKKDLNMHKFLSYILPLKNVEIVEYDDKNKLPYIDQKQ